MTRLALLLVFASATSARDAWIRLVSPHFEIYSDSGEKTARRVLGRFEEIRALFDNIASDSVQMSQPVRIFVFASEAGFREVRPASIAQGFYQSGPQRDYIAMHSGGTELERVALHEFLHLRLNHSRMLLPRWLEEGLAEFYSTAEVRAASARIGLPIAAHVQTLASERWLAPAEFEAVGLDSAYYNEARKAGIFYAQSWALAHMLNLAPGYRERMPRYAELLSRDPGGAFERAFSKTMEAAFQDLREYLARGLPTVEVEAPASAPAAPWSAAALNPIEATLARADLLLHVGRRVEAARLYQQVARENPKSAAAVSGLAILALAQRRNDEARTQFERAFALGASDAATLFEYAMLLRETGAPRERVADYLRRAVAANPSFAEAHYLLGVRASDDGRYREAVEHLSAATRVLPRQSPFWHALAYAHHKLGQDEPARQAAFRAARTAATEQESEMAAALENLSRESPALRARRPAVSTPDTWRNPQGDTRVEAMLREVECRATPLRLRLEAGDKELVLQVTDPRAVTLKNAEGVSMEFPCGPQRRRVTVEYMRSTGEVTALELLKP